QREPERGDGAQRVAGLDGGRVAQWRTGAGVEEVERYLVRREGGELRRELGPLFEALAQAEDAAAAHLHAGRADHAQRVVALRPGVRGDHVREERAGRLQVVVVPVDAHRDQLVD